MLDDALARMILFLFPHLTEILSNNAERIVEFCNRLVRQPCNFDDVDAVIADVFLQLGRNLETIFEPPRLAPMPLIPEIQHERNDGINFPALRVHFIAIRRTIIAHDAERHPLVNIRLVLKPEKRNANLVLPPKFRDIPLLFAQLLLSMMRPIRRARQHVNELLRRNELPALEQQYIDEIREHIRILEQLLFRNILLCHAITSLVFCFIIPFQPLSRYGVNGKSTKISDASTLQKSIAIPLDSPLCVIMNRILIHHHLAKHILRFPSQGLPTM